MPKKKLGELLVMAGAIDELQLQSALGEQRKWGKHLGMTMVEMGLLKEEVLVAVLSKQLNIPAVKLNPNIISKKALSLLDYNFCFENSCIPIDVEDSGHFLDIAMADPTNPELFDRIRVATRCNVRPHLAGPKSIEHAVRLLYLGKSVDIEQTSYQDNRPWIARPDEMVFDEKGYARPALGIVDSRPVVAEAPPTSQTVESPTLGTITSSPSPDELIVKLHSTVLQLRSHLERDEKVLKKLMSLLVEKRVCTRQELIAKINED